jgi:non-heme chloroperoxidase
MQASLRSAFECIRAFSETDFTADLGRFDIPTLFLHGDDDQIVPLASSAALAVKLVKGAALKVYPGAPHGLCSTHKDALNADLLAFLQA